MRLIVLLSSAVLLLSSVIAAGPQTLGLRGGGSEKLCGLRFPHQQAPFAGKIEVVGSWDGFQKRSELRRAEDSKDQWLTVLKLGAGTYQLKFVVNENQWMCSDSMQVAADQNGNNNNVLTVAPSSSALQPSVDQSLRAYVPCSQDAVTDAMQIVSFLKATEPALSPLVTEAELQLADLLAAELKSALGALTGCQEHLKTSQRMCKELDVALKSEAAATVSDIGSQLTAVKEMMDAKEKKAIESVSSTCQTRLERMQSHLSEYNKALPELVSLIQKMQIKMKEAPKTSKEGLEFSDQAEGLLQQTESLTLKACQLPEPPMLHDFSQLSVDVPEA